MIIDQRNVNQTFGIDRSAAAERTGGSRPSPTSQRVSPKNKRATGNIPPAAIVQKIRLVLVYSDDLSAVVFAAVGADSMGSLILTALRADRQSRSLELPYVGSSLHLTSM